MTSRLNPYLNFNGNAREAMEFYRDVFGGELAVTMFADFGVEGPDAERVMHSQLDSDAGYTLMAADVMSTMEYQPMAGASVSISGDDSEVLHRYFEQLADGGTVTMPMAKQAWGDEFGMCVDRYGVPWLVNIGQS